MEDKHCYALQWKGSSTLSNHGIFATEKDAFESIAMWWNLNDFSPEYVRHWHKDNRMIIDYGLHDCFYYIIKIDRENFGDILFPVQHEIEERYESFNKMTVKELEDLVGDIVGDISGKLWTDQSSKPSFYLS